MAQVPATYLDKTGVKIPDFRHKYRAAPLAARHILITTQNRAQLIIFTMCAPSDPAGQVQQPSN
jgi:hypothetical protein